MEIIEFLAKLKNYNANISELTVEKSNFILENASSITEQRALQLRNDKKLFLELFPFILKHKDHFLNTTTNYVVDVFAIVTKVGKPLGTGYLRHDGITLKNLLKLWDYGFIYNGYPIVEYLTVDGTSNITYIKDGVYETVKLNHRLDDTIIKKATEMSYTIKNFEWDYKRVTDIKKDED